MDVKKGHQLQPLFKNGSLRSRVWPENPDSGWHLICRKSGRQRGRLIGCSHRLCASDFGPGSGDAYSGCVRGLSLCGCVWKSGRRATMIHVTGKHGAATALWRIYTDGWHSVGTIEADVLITENEEKKHHLGQERQPVWDRDKWNPSRHYQADGRTPGPVARNGWEKKKKHKQNCSYIVANDCGHLTPPLTTAPPLPVPQSHYQDLPRSRSPFTRMRRN